MTRFTSTDEKLYSGALRLTDGSSSNLCKVYDTANNQNLSVTEIPLLRSRRLVQPQRFQRAELRPRFESGLTWTKRSSELLNAGVFRTLSSRSSSYSGKRTIRLGNSVLIQQAVDHLATDNKQTGTAADFTIGKADQLWRRYAPESSPWTTEPR
jgi:hypothetical protein